MIFEPKVLPYSKFQYKKDRIESINIQRFREKSEFREVDRLIKFCISKHCVAKKYPTNFTVYKINNRKQNFMYLGIVVVKRFCNS